MNTENNKKLGGVILSTIIKILVVLAIIFLLLWLFPTKQSLNPLYEEIFRNNINSMKDAAETYFTNERLPEEVGESVKLSLREMLDKNLLLPFVDRYNKECDLDDSYVEITKTETEYELKVNLVCSKEDAFIIEHLGCTDKCIDCKKENEVVKKEKECTSCKTPEKTPEKDPEKPNKPEPEKIIEYQFKRETSKQVISGYTCPNGYELDGTSCKKTTTTTLTKEPTPITKVVTTSVDAKKNTTYGEWSKAKVEEYLAGNEKDLVNATSCPSGYTKIGSATTEGNSVIKCFKKEKNIEYGETDTKKISVVTYDNGSENYVVGPDKIYETYKFKVGSMNVKECSKYKYFIDTKVNIAYSYSGNGGSGYTGFDFISCGNTCSLYPTYYISSYSGVGQIGNVTTSTDERLRATCEFTTKNIPVYAEGKRIVEYDYKWYRKYSISERTAKTTYSCDAGYKLDGTKCTKSETKIVGYSCPENYSLKGNTCERVITNTDLKDATPTYKTETNVEYTWSRNKTLAGWTFTGKTRTVTK